MSDSHRRLATALTYAGILPPWLALAAHVTGVLPHMAFISLAYGAIIASFVCGIHWGVFLRPAGDPKINLFVSSNIGALAAWAMLLASLWSTAAAFIGLAIIVGALLLVDRQLHASGVIESWFWSVRRIASAGLGGAMLAWGVLAILTV